jgi:hypothetical protein
MGGLKDVYERIRERKKSHSGGVARETKRKGWEGREMRGWWVVYFGVFSSFFCVFLSEWK